MESFVNMQRSTSSKCLSHIVNLILSIALMHSAFAQDETPSFALDTLLVNAIELTETKLPNEGLLEEEFVALANDFFQDNAYTLDVILADPALDTPYAGAVAQSLQGETLFIGLNNSEINRSLSFSEDEHHQLPPNSFVIGVKGFSNQFAINYYEGLIVVGGENAWVSAPLFSVSDYAANLTGQTFNITGPGTVNLSGGAELSITNVQRIDGTPGDDEFLFVSSDSNIDIIDGGEGVDIFTFSSETLAGHGIDTCDANDYNEVNTGEGDITLSTISSTTSPMVQIIGPGIIEMPDQCYEAIELNYIDYPTLSINTQDTIVASATINDLEIEDESSQKFDRNSRSKSGSFDLYGLLFLLVLCAIRARKK